MSENTSLDPKMMKNWEEQFDREFYEGVYCLAESDGEYYHMEDKVKAFIRILLLSVPIYQSPTCVQCGEEMNSGFGGWACPHCGCVKEA